MYTLNETLNGSCQNKTKSNFEIFPFAIRYQCVFVLDYQYPDQAFGLIYNLAHIRNGIPLCIK